MVSAGASKEHIVYPPDTYLEHLRLYAIHCAEPHPVPIAGGWVARERRRGFVFGTCIVWNDHHGESDEQQEGEVNERSALCAKRGD